jgi:hypothetical protein
MLGTLLVLGGHFMNTLSSVVYLVEVTGLEAYESPVCLALQVFTSKEAAIEAAFVKLKESVAEDSYFYEIKAEVYISGLNGANVSAEGVQFSIEPKKPTKLMVEEEFIQTTRGDASCLEFINRHWGALQTAKSFLEQLKRGV